MGDILDLIHVKIHALRMMPNYKATIFEQEINRLIAEEFSSDCKECKQKYEQFKYQPIQNEKSFLGGLFK